MRQKSQIVPRINKIELCTPQFKCILDSEIETYRQQEHQSAIEDISQIEVCDFLNDAATHQNDDTIFEIRNQLKSPRRESFKTSRAPVNKIDDLYKIPLKNFSFKIDKEN